MRQALRVGDVGDLDDPLSHRELLCGGRGAQHRRIDRHVADGQDGAAVRREGERDQRRGRRGAFRVGGEEDVRDGEPSRSQLAAGEPGEERHREVHRDPAAVADALGGHPAAVRHGAEGTMSEGEHVVGLHPVLADDQPDAAARVLRGGVVQSGRCHVAVLLQ